MGLMAPTRANKRAWELLNPGEKVCGLDPSMAATGWAIGSLEAPPTSGVFPPLTGSDRQRFHGLYLEIQRLHQRYGFKYCYFEFDAAMQGVEGKTDVSEGYRFACKTVILLAGAMLNFFTQPVSANAWRPGFIGCTRKPAFIKTQSNRAWLKEAAVAECKKRGWVVRGDDEAEARGVLDYGLCQLSAAYAAKMAGPLGRYAR